MTAYEIPAKLLPENEADRINALHQYEILDTPSETGFDALALLAAGIFESKHAHICFVDQENVHYKANTDNSAPAITSRKDSLCALSIMNNHTTVLKNDLKLPEEIIFYAAAPISNEQGFVLGSIAVTDNKPHEQVTDQQLKMLEMLAALVMEKLETRLAEQKTAMTYNDRLRTLAHDIKNPVTSISLYAQLLSSKEMNSEKVFSMASRIETSVKRIEEKLNNLFM